MAKQATGGKAQRVLRFLLGLSHPRIAAVLVGHGFSQDDLDEGWRLLRELRTVRLDPSAPDPPTAQETVALLDRWENEWFPVARATLRRHFPKQEQAVFHRIGQTQGNEVVLSVSAFLARIDGLPLVPDGKKALELLRRRGLTPAVMSEARQLLTRLREPPGMEHVEVGSPPPPDPRAEWPAREAALWGWYLEWGSIAQKKIKDRNLLRQLGFLASARGSRAGEKDPEPLEPG